MTQWVTRSTICQRLRLVTPKLLQRTIRNCLVRSGAGFNGHQYGINSGNGLSGNVWNRVSSTSRERVRVWVEQVIGHKCKRAPNPTGSTFRFSHHPPCRRKRANGTLQEETNQRHMRLGSRNACRSRRELRTRPRTRSGIHLPARRTDTANPHPAGGNVAMAP